MMNLMGGRGTILFFGGLSVSGSSPGAIGRERTPEEADGLSLIRIFIVHRRALLPERSCESSPQDFSARNFGQADLADVTSIAMPNGHAGH
jgi:hypothetical protein